MSILMASDPETRFGSVLKCPDPFPNIRFRSQTSGSGFDQNGSDPTGSRDMDEIYFNFISLGFGTSSRIGSGLYQKGQDLQNL
jgi:hypothetical protein